MFRDLPLVLLVAACLAACGVPTEEHQRTMRELEQVTTDLQAANSRIEELEEEVAKLRETDTAYWQDVHELKNRGQWPEVRSKISELLERWPDTEFATQARRLDQEATETMAAKLYETAREAMERDRFEAAKATLIQVRDSYPGTRAHSQAVADLRGIDRQIDQARRRAIGSGKWRVSSETSPIDDSTNVYVSLTANNTVSGRFGDDVRPVLVVRCKENHTEIIVNWHMYLGIGTTRVLHRLDDRAAQTRTWSLSTDYEATFYRGSNVAFVNELMNHERLLLQTVPHGEDPVTATFSIAGLENAVISLREACHW